MGAYSKLHNLTYHEIKKHFPHYTIRENIRPDWLVSSKNTKLELDLYIEQINTAIEIQGMQHYEFTPHFHKTYKDFQEQQRRDQEKRDLCRGRKVRLVEIAMSMDLHVFIKELLLDKEPETWQLPLSEQRRLDRKVERKPKSNKKSALINPKFRKWIKKVILQGKGKISPNMFRTVIQKLPGSHKQRNRARNLLLCEYLGDSTWKVWGGEGIHEVRNLDGKFYCSCKINNNAEGKLCSHIIKVQMDDDVFPKREIVVDLYSDNICARKTRFRNEASALKGMDFIYQNDLSVKEGDLISYRCTECNKIHVKKR